MPRCSAILEGTGQVCNSNAKLNKVRVEDPNERYSKTMFLCQKCSDRIYGPMDALLQHWMANKNVDWEIKKAEITKIRWRSCRHCNHSIDCHCSDPVCQNIYDEKWHVIFWSSTGQLRQDFMLHRRCAFIIMKKLGMMKELQFLTSPTGMEKFMDIKLTEPVRQKPVVSSYANTTPYKKRCKTCDIWLEDSKYQEHMNQHYRESSTDSMIEKQYLGRTEKKVETHVCELHERRAVFVSAKGQYVCPVFGCIEQIKLKMVAAKEYDDFLICLFHQCKMVHEPNSGKYMCRNPECNGTDLIKKSFLMQMVKDGFIEYRGKKFEIDIDSRTVFIEGKKIILKI